MRASSVGVPGREKSTSTPFRKAHWSSMRPANSVRRLLWLERQVATA
jgi:hypothetical protein